MKKYYIYLNGQQYMEMPEEYNINNDVYLQLSQSNSGHVWGVAYTRDGKNRINMAYKMHKAPHMDMMLADRVLKHELKHIEQYEQDPRFASKYTVSRILYGYQQSPYEIESREAGEQYLPIFHRVGKYDILYQKALEKLQKKYPEWFKLEADIQKSIIGKSGSWYETYKEGYKGEESVREEEKKKQEQERLVNLRTIEYERSQAIEEQVFKGKYRQPLIPKATEILRKRLEKFMK